MEKDLSHTSQKISKITNEVIEKEAFITGECYEMALKDGIITKEEFLEEPIKDNFEHIIEHAPDGNVIIIKSLRLNREIFRVVTYLEEKEIVVQGLLTYRISEESKKDVMSEIKIL